MMRMSGWGTAFLVLVFTAGWGHAANEVDVAVRRHLERCGTALPEPCSDAVFLRRAFLDTTGQIPTLQQTRRFLETKTGKKREKLVDQLLSDGAFADYQAMQWFDLLRVKSEFPCNLWPNAAQAYSSYILESCRADKTYDVFARELLTTSGSNFRDPAVNFYRALPMKNAEGIASFAAQIFLGSRFEKWNELDRRYFMMFFEKVGYKSTEEWKEELVFSKRDKPFGSNITSEVAIRMPDKTYAVIRPEQDPREAFADWLIRADNLLFARVAVNRIWYRLMGTGVVQEADDWRTDNPPMNPELLDVLADIFVKSGYNVKAVYKAILLSDTYGRCAPPDFSGINPQTVYAFYKVRQLEAEVLEDIFSRLVGDGESYTSQVPEPFTHTPTDEKTVLLGDGSITSPFLEAFGRPSRDSGLLSERVNEPSSYQRILLLNSSRFQNRVYRPLGNRLLPRDVAKLTPEKAAEVMVDRIYLELLCRHPSVSETATIEAYRVKSKLPPAELCRDTVWAVINSSGFLFRY